MQFSANCMYLGTTFDEKMYCELEREATTNYMLDEMAYQEDREVPRKPFVRLVEKIPSEFKKVMKKTKVAFFRPKSQRDVGTPFIGDGSERVQLSPNFNESRAHQHVSTELHPSSSPIMGELKSVLPEEAVSRVTSAFNKISSLTSRSHAEIPTASSECEVGRPIPIIREYEPVQNVTLEFVSASSPPKEDANSIHESPASSKEEKTGSTFNNRNKTGSCSIYGSPKDAPKKSLFSRVKLEADTSEGHSAEDYVCHEDGGPRRVKSIGPCEESKPYVQSGTVQRLATLLGPLWAGKVSSDDLSSDLSTDSVKEIRANSSAP